RSRSVLRLCCFSSSGEHLDRDSFPTRRSSDLGPGVDTQNSVFQVVSGSNNYGTKATTTNSDWSSAVWQEGRQYVVFRDVRVVNGGDALTVTVLPGASGYAIINGMQFELLAQSNPTNSSCVSAPSGLISWWRGEG